MSYNGWTNYETWNVKLWIDNEEPSYRYWKEVASTAWEDAEPDRIFTKSEAARRVLATQLEDEISEIPDNINDAIGGTMYDDLLGAALSDVRWDEIANSLLEECGDPYESCEFMPTEA